MSPDTERQILEVLREIRDGQGEVISRLAAHHALAEEQMSRTAVDESMRLQREALKRQRSIALIAVPGILARIAAIAYLVLRYF